VSTNTRLDMLLLGKKIFIFVKMMKRNKTF